MLRPQQIASVLAVIVSFFGFVAAVFLSRKSSAVEVFPLLILPVFASGIAALTSLLMTAELRRRRMAREVFLLYPRHNLDTALSIAKVLKDADFSPWLDRERILPGQIWKEEIKKAIEKSGVVLILLSDKDRSSFVNEEISLVIGRRNSKSVDSPVIIPVISGDANVPEELKDIQYLDLRSDGWQEELIRALMIILRPRNLFSDSLKLLMKGP